MSLIVNPQGGRLTDQRAMEQMSAELDRIGAETDEIHQKGAADVVQVLDKFVAVREYEEFGINIWVEGESDVCLHFYPAQRAPQFSFPGTHPGRDATEAFTRMSDQVGGNLIYNAVGKMPADANYYLAEAGSQRTPQFDPTRKGIDLFEVRLFGLFKRPRWSTVTAEFVHAHRAGCKHLAQYRSLS